MELIEKISINKVSYLKEFSLEDFLKLKKFKNKEEGKFQHKQLIHYCEGVIKARGECKRLYGYSDKTRQGASGRLFSGGSIQCLPKQIRGFLMSHTTDIDMVNCHPVLLKYICNKHNIPCAYLSLYIEDRDLYTSQILDGKSCFLSSINNDKINRKIKNPFFNAFDKEMKSIQKTIYNLVEYNDYLNTDVDKAFNWLGSSLNRILCYYENKILQTAISVITKNNIEIGVLMFDGLMVYGEPEIELLNEIFKAVENVFIGLNMRWSFKEHNNDIIIPDGWKPRDKKINEMNSFDKVALEFEKTHCKIINNSFFIKECDDEILIKSKQEMKISYEHLVYEKLNKDGDIVNACFINAWMVENKTQSCYEYIGCFPTGVECPSNTYNSWRPFAMENIIEWVKKPTALEVFKKHILIMCNNDPLVATYIEAWIAQMIQYPAVKSICPTFISKQGAGKGTLMKLLYKMFGDKKCFETATPSRDVWGDFNGRMASSFFINLDELSRKESLECEGKIKALITNPKITINNKGINQYDINSFHRFCGTTNGEDPWKTTKDDRRNVIIKSSDELIGDVVYFNNINDLLDDVNVIKTCYEYFKSIPDMENFNKLERPVTDYQKDMQELSVSPIENWIKSFTIENYYQEEVKHLGKKYFELFKEWCKKCGIEYNINIQAFGVRIKRLNISGIEKGEHTNKGEMKIFNIKLLRKHFKLDNVDVIVVNDDDDDDDE